MSPLERFDAASLSDKINGKAELYLSAGFVGLETRRFTVNADAWLEIFHFTMASPRAAFAVYSGQRRADATPLDTSADGYIAGNGVFLTSGPHYIELIASDTAAAATAPDLAAALQARLPVRHGAEAAPASPLPEAALVPGSLSLIPENAFGLAELDDVLIGRLPVADGEYTVFASLRTSPDDASALAETYTAFLLANGGKALAPPAAIPDARLIELYGFHELVFCVGPILAGVREAGDAVAAAEAARVLHDHIRKWQRHESG